MKTNLSEFNRKIIFKKPEFFEEYFNIYYPMVKDNLDEKNSEIINDKCFYFRREVKPNSNSTWIKCSDSYFEIYPTNREAMINQILLETFMSTLTWFLTSLNKEKIDDDDYIERFKTYITENDADIREELMEIMGIEE